MELVINNNLFNVKFVMNRRDIERGMMNKKFNKDFNGMLFLMPDKEHSFWMKNCIISLDIIFIKDNKITKIHKNCKPCRDEKCKRYPGKGDMVLEINGGDCDKYDIIVGDKIIFQD
jgi:hypothetical protein